MTPLLPWIIAAACLWRGLTEQETDNVATALDQALTAEDDPVTAGRAHQLLESAIANVVEASRGVILEPTAQARTTGRS